ncbi:XRE family transcriptional regulator [Mesorhizobium sp. WSM4976]|jgi:transcriptional regulator with XRE-family HTH domain|uniref:helix-turn-helix domain-containing protein n=1 Tax=Mesorhizobium sp. WSM4976 TaxID=3038549 RepID=UPI0024171B90|nr:transcriptional regulator [Mesorhizobium sp. WSM4976]MDG4892631.1 XRE family transcriptional regulator [Mesorhizobium sp. WSM4976]
MAIKDVRAYIEKHGLVETTDDEIEKPFYRKPGFDGIRSFAEMEQIFSQLIREKRDNHNLNRAQAAMMVGLHEQIFARYERAFSKLTVTRLIHLAEILEFSPIELIYAAAPHLFGDTKEEARDKKELVLRILDMPASTTHSLLQLIVGLSPAEDNKL